MSELVERSPFNTVLPRTNRSFHTSWIGFYAGLAVALVVSAAAQLSWPPRTWTWPQASAVLHLLIPLWVLVVQFYILYRMMEERRERERVIEDLNSFRISLGRSNYMQEIARAISEANEAVVFTSTTMEASWNSSDQRRIVEGIKRRERERPKYVHRGLIARRAEAIPGALELLCDTRVDVRMSDAILMSRVRFVVRDQSFSVIGVAEGQPTIANQPATKRSVSVEGAMLATALRQRFDQLWENAISPWKYIDELIAAASHNNVSFTKDNVLDLLNIPHERRKDISALLESHCTTFANVRPTAGSTADPNETLSLR
jgi:hypothetical protein